MIVSLQEKRSEKMENHILCGGKWVHYKECKGNLFTLVEDDFEFEVRISEEILAIEYDKTIPVYVAITEDGILTTCIHLDRENVLRELVETYIVKQKN